MNPASLSSSASANAAPPKPEATESELLAALRRRLVDAAIHALDTCRFDDACALVGAYKAVTL